MKTTIIATRIERVTIDETTYDVVATCSDSPNLLIGSYLEGFGDKPALRQALDRAKNAVGTEVEMLDFSTRLSKEGPVIYRS